MNLDWLAEGRKIPDEVMYYIRVMAVNSIRVLGQSPEDILPNVHIENGHKPINAKL